MDKISINKNDSTNIFRPLLFINDNFDLSIYKNDCDFWQTNDLNLNLSSLPLIDPPMIEQFDKYNIYKLRIIIKNLIYFQKIHQIIQEVYFKKKEINL